MVTISTPSACTSGTRQLLTSWPSSRTEQAPHSPSPHPSFVPVRRNPVRNASSRRIIGCPLTSTSSPLTRQWIETLGSTTSRLHERQDAFRSDWYAPDV